MTDCAIENELPRQSISVDLEPQTAADTCQMLEEQIKPVNITFYNISHRVRTGIGLRYKRGKFICIWGYNLDIVI